MKKRKENNSFDNRTKQFNLRLTEEEAKKLKKLSDEHDTSCSEYIRQAIRTQTPIPKDLKAELIDKVVLGINAQSNIGNNINQLTHTVHILMNNITLGIENSNEKLQAIFLRLIPLLEISKEKFDEINNKISILSKALLNK